MARDVAGLLLDLHEADVESLLGEAEGPVMETALDLLLLSGETAHSSFTNRI